MSRATNTPTSAAVNDTPRPDFSEYRKDSIRANVLLYSYATAFTVSRDASSIGTVAVVVNAGKGCRLRERYRGCILGSMTKLPQWVAGEISRIADRDGISRADLARRLGVSRARITRMLDADSNLQLATVERVAEALGVVVDLRFRRPS